MAKPPAVPQGAVSGINVAVVLALADPAQTLAQPAPKCRNGLPASPCAGDTKALIHAPLLDRPSGSGEGRVIPQLSLGDGIADRPALPPPRRA